MTAALQFTPDTHSLEGNQIMGRRAAGAAFLRAVVEGRQGTPVVGYVSRPDHGELFTRQVRAIDPGAEAQWIERGRHDQLAGIGVLQLPDPRLAPEARLRLRGGSAGFSLCGITHTLSSTGTLEALGAILFEPVMPWDAVICTSSVAREVVSASLGEAAEQARWRLGEVTIPELPQLPIIPLGVHAADWQAGAAARYGARQRLDIGPNRIVVLFAGRLSFAAKAHPFQMYAALQAVAERTGKPLTLLLSGQFYTEPIEAGFRSFAEAVCPSIDYRHVDGADPGLYAAGYAAADIFMSLSDNPQETFGITPLEAMAAAIPVLVSDWNGYRDTVRDGIDGFRIPSWAPSAGAGDAIARAYESDGDYDRHSSRTSTTISVDMAVLIERLSLLVLDPALRRRMGEAARARVLDAFDWPVVYRQYRALWGELDAVRRHRSADAVISRWLANAPPAHHAHDDPFRRFAGYPTHAIDAATVVRTAPGANRAAYEALIAHPFFGFWRTKPDLVEKLLEAAAAPLTITMLADAIERPVEATIIISARLVKMNLLIAEAGTAAI